MAPTPEGRPALRRRLATALLLAALSGAVPGSASGHAGLIGAEPSPGATLGATPSAVRLTLSEQPEPSLSEIRVLGPGGVAEQRGGPKSLAGDPLTLGVPVRPLARGVYTVSWKAISAVDGHATEGTYAFGVRASPRGGAVEASTTTPSSSPLELVARFALLVGVVVLLGASVAAASRPGAPWPTDLVLAGAGWGVAAIGLLALAEAQRRTAGSSLGALLDTPVGDGLIWRAVPLALAGVGLLVAWRIPAARRGALAAVAAAALGAIVAQAAGGHAAAGSWSEAVSIGTEAAHFAAAGVWLGGLAALLAGLGKATPEERATGTRRFAAVALASLLAVLGTGTLRAVDELGSLGDLLNSGYGRAILAKALLIALIAVLAARNRKHGVPAVARDPSVMRGISRWELCLAVAALAVAALLGTLAPPVSGELQTLGLSASGADFGTTTRVTLTTASEEPGPNLFTVEVEDYDSGQPVRGNVSLRFTPLDDPGVEASSLSLSRSSDGTYVGSGSNLAFDGRWGIDVRVQRGNDSVDVPLRLELPDPTYFVSVLRVPGQAPKYTMRIGSIGYIRVEPDPEREGPSRLYVECYTPFGSPLPVDPLILTIAASDEPARQQPVQRIGRARFVAEVELPAGPIGVGVVAHAADGTRLRGVFQLEIPGG